MRENDEPLRSPKGRPQRLLPLPSPEAQTLDSIVDGDRVFVPHLGSKGVVRYRGAIEGLPGEWLGVELVRPVGNSDGAMNSRRYFTCGAGQGIFLRSSSVRKLLADDISPTASSSVASYHPEMTMLDERADSIFVEAETKLENGSQRSLSQSFARQASFMEPSFVLDADEKIELAPTGNLDWPPTARNVEVLRRHFEDHYQRLVPISYVTKLLELSHQLLMLSALCPNMNLHAAENTGLVVVGDIHGHLNDLLWLLYIHGPPDTSGKQFIFNGDFVDRGNYGMEVLVLILTMKCVWPDLVFLNRGNHENLSANIMYGFSRECQTKYNALVFQLCQEVFDSLPVAHIIQDSILIVHGGLPRVDITLDQIRSLPRCFQVSGAPVTANDIILFDLLWADPIPSCGRANGGRGPQTWQFGPDITHQFLTANQLTHIVRSHQVPPSGQGFEVAHDGRLITVFSASNYCGVTGNLGAVLLITRDLTFEVSEYYSPPLEELKSAVAAGLTGESAPAAADILEATLAHIRNFIVQKKKELHQRFKALAGKDGTLITQVEWIQTMAFTLELDLDWVALLPHLVDPTPDGRVDYEQFLARYQVDAGSMMQEWVSAVRGSLHQAILRHKPSLQSIFDMFDLNRNGFVNPEELITALGKLDIMPTRGQLEALTAGLVHNDNNEVLVSAFVESLYQGLGTSRVPLDPDTQATLDRLRRVIRRSGHHLVNLFIAADTDGNGKVEYSEFLVAMRDILKNVELDEEISDAEILRAIEALDTAKSGSICYLEFVDAFAQSLDAGQKMVNSLLQSLMQYRISLERAFILLDVEGNGRISPEKFAEGLASLNALLDGPCLLSDQDISSLVAYLDTNEDGMVDYSEFCHAFSVVDTRSLKR